MQTPTADTAASQIASASSTGRVVTGIREAASATGVSFDYLLSQAARESGLDPQACNSRSSAAGLFQFTSQTWMDMVRRHGAKHGLDAEAAAIVRGPNGRLDVADKTMKAAILDLRKDPELSAMMAAEYARDNSKVLERKLGRPVTASDLHLAHLLGAGGAVRVIEGMASNPDNSAHSLLPEAARANPELFRDPGSREARSITSLYNSVQARHMGASKGRADLAALRPEPRPDLDVAPAAEPQPAASAPPTVAEAVAPPTATLAATTEAAPPTSPSVVTTAALSGGTGFRAAIPREATARVEVRSMKDIVDAIRAGQDV